MGLRARLSLLTIVGFGLGPALPGLAEDARGVAEAVPGGIAVSEAPNAPGLAPLPSPLTLEHALSLADDPHPELNRAAAALEEARARQHATSASDNLEASVELAARTIDPSKSTEYQERNDSYARFRLSKRIYDFGRTQRAEEASDSELSGREWDYIDARQKRRLDIMTRYFNVLLSDLENSRDTEAMATAYVTMDRARARSQLGQVSDIDLLKIESDYQNALRRQRESVAKQRAVRLRLGMALNRVDQPASELTTPALTSLDRERGDVETWIEEALNANPRLQALRQQVDAQGKRVESARAGARPIVNGTLEAASYNRELGGRDPFAAGIVLEWPLFSGGRVQAEVDTQQARLRRERASLGAEEMAVRESVMDTWLEIGTLQARREALGVLGDYRELYMDNSRALYEMEVKSDLGDAMVQISDLRLQRAQADFELALAWARLDALSGRLVSDGISRAGDQTSAANTAPAEGEGGTK